MYYYTYDLKNYKALLKYPQPPDVQVHCHVPIFWLREPAGFLQESDMQIRKSLKGDDYFKWYRLLMAIVENHGECAIPFGNLHDTAHSNL